MLCLYADQLDPRFVASARLVLSRLYRTQVDVRLRVRLAIFGLRMHIIAWRCNLHLHEQAWQCDFTDTVCIWTVMGHSHFRAGHSTMPTISAKDVHVLSGLLDDPRFDGRRLECFDLFTDWSCSIVQEVSEIKKKLFR